MRKQSSSEPPSKVSCLCHERPSSFPPLGLDPGPPRRATSPGLLLGSAAGLLRPLLARRQQLQSFSGR